MAKPNHFLIPVMGGSADDEAIRTACVVAQKHHSRVSVIFVIEVKRALPLDADIQTELERGERILERAERVAGECGVEVETELLQARDVGPAIVDEAVERSCDVVVIGLPHTRRFSDYTLGDTVTHVLKNSPSWVWVVREPAHQNSERT